MKINIQVFPYLLNNFTYAPFVCLVWPKCSNYVIKVKNRTRFSIIQCITPYLFKLDAWKLISKYFHTCWTTLLKHLSPCLVWSKCSNYVMKVKNKSRFNIITKKFITPYLFNLDAWKLISKYFLTCLTTLLMHLSCV